MIKQKYEARMALLMCFLFVLPVHIMALDYADDAIRLKADFLMIKPYHELFESNGRKTLFLETKNRELQIQIDVNINHQYQVRYGSLPALTKVKVKIFNARAHTESHIIHIANIKMAFLEPNQREKVEFSNQDFADLNLSKDIDETVWLTAKSEKAHRGFAQSHYVRIFLDLWLLDKGYVKSNDSLKSEIKTTEIFAIPKLKDIVAQKINFKQFANVHLDDILRLTHAQIFVYSEKWGGTDSLLLPIEFIWKKTNYNNTLQ